MGRVAKFLPRFDRKAKRWRLNVPDDVSPTGRRRREFFDSRKAADQRAAALEAIRVDRNAAAARWATPQLIADAVECHAAAVDLGFPGLRSAFETMAADWMARNRTATFGELLAAFEQDHRGNWSSSYDEKRWRPFRKMVSPLEATKLGATDTRFWRDWLSDWSKKADPAPATYNQVVATLRAVYRHELGRKFQPANPLEPIPSRRMTRREVCVATPPAVDALLAWCWEHDRDLIPYLVLGFFAGLRPDSELRTLQFAAIRQAEGFVDVRSGKTKSRRQVPLEPNAAAWLAPFGRRKGFIIVRNHRRRFDAARSGAAELLFGKDSTHPFPWGHDIMRHSYGSFWEAAHRGETGCRDRLVYQMGHTDFKTFDQYYRNDRTPEEAAAFWAIAPPQGEKIVAIA